MALHDEVLEVFRTESKRVRGLVTLSVREVRRLILISRRENAFTFLGLVLYIRPSIREVHTAIHDLKGDHPNLSRSEKLPTAPARLTLVHTR